MYQTIFNENEILMMREMVFETTLMDWCVAWQQKDAGTLDQLAIVSAQMAGPEADSAACESLVITIYNGMQQTMINDLQRRGGIAPSRLLDDIRAIASRCKLALEQLNKGAQNGPVH